MQTWFGMSFLLGLLALAFNCTGCAMLDRDGFEISASAGIHRVNEYQQSHAMSGQAVPFKCYFVNCNATQEVK